MRLESQGGALVVREDVAGAPVRLGQRVHVDGDEEDGSLDERFVDCVGVVTGFLYDDVPSQFPQRPLVLVHVDGLGEELFFAHELREVGQGARLGVGPVARA